MSDTEGVLELLVDDLSARASGGHHQKAVGQSRRKGWAASRSSRPVPPTRDGFPAPGGHPTQVDLHAVRDATRQGKRNRQVFTGGLFPEIPE